MTNKTGRTSIALHPSGNFLDFKNIDPKVIEIQDIAHALSLQCRYNGHVNAFYSVAQHSTIVSLLVDPKYALAGLLHDAAEAYLGDVVTPLKDLLPTYKRFETSLEIIIAEKFGFDVNDIAKIKDIDHALQNNEMYSLFDKEVAMRTISGPLLTCAEIIPLSAGTAEAQFLNRYKELIFKAPVISLKDYSDFKSCVDLT